MFPALPETTRGPRRFAAFAIASGQVRAKLMMLRPINKMPNPLDWIVSDLGFP